MLTSFVFTMYLDTSVVRGISV